MEIPDFAEKVGFIGIFGDFVEDVQAKWGEFDVLRRAGVDFGGWLCAWMLRAPRLGRVCAGSAGPRLENRGGRAETQCFPVAGSQGLAAPTGNGRAPFGREARTVRLLAGQLKKAFNPSAETR